MNQEPLSDTPTPQPAAVDSALGNIGSRIRRGLRTVAWWAMMLFLVLVARLAADHLVPLRMAESFLAMHRAAAVGGAIGVAALGLVLFIIALIELALQSGAGAAPLDRTAAGPPVPKQIVCESPEFAYRRSAGRFVGKSVNLEVQDSWTVKEMKDVWHSGEWKRDPVWRRRYTAFAGAMLLVLGGFGFWVVYGPPWIVLLCGAALFYALVRIIWMFWRA